MRSALVAWLVVVTGCAHVDTELLSRARNGTVAVCARGNTGVWHEEVRVREPLSPAATAGLVAVVVLVAVPFALLTGRGGSIPLGGGAGPEDTRSVLDATISLDGARLEGAFAEAASAASGLTNIARCDEDSQVRTLRIDLSQSVHSTSYEGKAWVIGTRGKPRSFLCYGTLRPPDEAQLPLADQLQRLGEACAKDLGRQFGTELASIERALEKEGR